MAEEKKPKSSKEQKETGRREFLKRSTVGLLLSPITGQGPELWRERASFDGEQAFQSNWPEDVERVWLGPAYWTNPLQDWRLSSGRVEMVNSGQDRNVQLLTRQLGTGEGTLAMRVQVGYPALRQGGGRAGFEVGVQGPLREYRNNAVHGEGLRAGLTSGGQLFIDGAPKQDLAETSGLGDGIELQLAAEPTGGSYVLTLSARDPRTGDELGQLERRDVRPELLVGNLSVFADFKDEDGANLEWGDPRVWMRDLSVAGSKLETHTNHAFGPILFAQHTLSRGVLKMTAQMPPLGQDEQQTVKLQVKRSGAWRTVGEEPIDELSRTAHFRVTGWDATQDVPYRLVYWLREGDGQEEYHYHGTIRREPVDRDELVVGGLSCETDPGFPHKEVAEGVQYHDPDVLAFVGDQYYEGTGGYGVQRNQENISLAALDMLHKWFMHGWSFGRLMRDRPTICMTDDHDVFQGNHWGEGGKDVDTYEAHRRGGYLLPAEWINAVQRTQTAHLPDPYDPSPALNGIEVYYTDMLYGRVSFGILEDRKWKSGPVGVVPPNPGRADHITDPDYDPMALDAPGAVLLGERQLDFLEDWASDWRGADMKVAVSQTCFAQVPTHHGGDFMFLVADLDSNGWPQTPRNEAVRRLRKGFAFHLGGDQHLPMIMRYGVEDWEDSGFNYSVPAICTGYPRWFWPEETGRYDSATGRYTDGLANKVTLHAVANPEREYRQGVLQRLADKSSGYGILRINKESGDITMEAWPLLSDPRQGDSEQFPDWPKSVNMQDNYGRQAAAYLPTLAFEGVRRPVVQVIDESNGEVVYTLRIKGSAFRPKVFREGSYTVRAGEDGEWQETVENVASLDADAEETLEIAL